MRRGGRLAPRSREKTKYSMHFLLRVAAGIDWLNEQVGRIVIWLSVLMILIGVYNAGARYIGAFLGMHLGSNAYLEAQWYLFGIMFMLGGAYALRHNAHVRVDVMYGRLGQRGRAAIDLAGSVILLMPFCAGAIWLSWDWLMFSWSIGETSSNPGGLPRYPIKTVVPLAFALIFLQGGSQAIKSLAVLTGHRGGEHGAAEGSSR